MSNLRTFLSLSIGVVLSLFVNTTSAHQIQPFSAMCVETSARSFIESTDFEGEHTPGAWSDEGTLGGKWHFKYDGDDELVVDGRNVQVIASHDGVLLAASYGSSGIGTNGWLYVVHLGLNKIVATTAGAYGGYEARGAGVVISSVELRCTFSE